MTVRLGVDQLFLQFLAYFIKGPQLLEAAGSRRAAPLTIHNFEGRVQRAEEPTKAVEHVFGLKLLYLSVAAFPPVILNLDKQIDDEVTLIDELQNEAHQLLFHYRKVYVGTFLEFARGYILRLLAYSNRVFSDKFLREQTHCFD